MIHPVNPVKLIPKIRAHSIQFSQEAGPHEPAAAALRNHSFLFWNLREYLPIDRHQLHAA